MRKRAVSDAAAMGISVCVMSASAPAALFVLGPVVYYRPTGCPIADAALIRLGAATVALVLPERVTAQKAR